MFSFFECAHTDFMAQPSEELEDLVKAEIMEAGGKITVAAKYNASPLPEKSPFHRKQKDFRKLRGFKNSIILCNPPDGIREKAKNYLQTRCGDFGNFLKKKWTGSPASIHCGDREMISTSVLRPPLEKAIPIDGRLVQLNLS